MNTKKYLMIAPLFTCTLLSACVKTVKTADKAPAPVKVETVQLYTASAGARYSASIVSGSQVEVSFSVGGYLDRIMQVRGADGRLRSVQQGDSVARGAALAALRVKDYSVKVDQAAGQLAQVRASLVTSERQVREAEVSLEKARLDFERAEALFASQSMTKPDYDAAKSQYDISKAKTETARSQLAVITAQIAAAEAAQAAASISRDDTIVRAPIDGLLLERAVEVGEIVSPGKPAFVLADTSFVKAIFGVPDLDVQNLKLGSALTVDIDALPGRSFTGQITSVSPSADQKTRLFEVEVSIRNPERTIKLGMIASLALASATNEAVPVVPLNAIVRSKEEPDQYSLFVIEVQDATESARLRSVTLGEAFGNRVAVMSGVKVGDRVITSGGSRLVDGQAVQVIP